MKNLYIYIAFVVALLFTSCNKFLDIQPVGQVIPTTAQDFRDLMTNAYETVPTDRSLSSVRGDELQLILDSWGDYTPYENIFTWNDVHNDENTIQYAWQQFYKSILNTNLTIHDGKSATDGKQDEIDQLRGEAYILRAYLHFSLAGLYSDVYNADNLNKKAFPLSVKIDIWQNYTRNTVGEVYTQIFSDIDEGIKLLQLNKQPVGLNYRFSLVSAYGFAARVYAYSGNWDKAKEYAEKAYTIEHELIDLNDPTATLPTKYTSVENILALEQTFYADLKNRFNISEKLIGAYDKVNDLRFAKYFTPNGSDYRCAIGYSLENKVSMRTSEFYLLLAQAEAKSSGGNLTKGKTYLKDLLSKRLTPSYYAAESAKIDGLGKEAFVEYVAQERFRELACQGFRWYDLRYFGKPELEKIFGDEIHVLKEGDIRYIVPFPQEAIENNPNLLN